MLKCGFEPNERVEGFLETFNGVEDLTAHTGFAPVQVLAAAALDVMTCKDDLGVGLYMNTMKEISSAMETLVRFGGRLSLDPPPFMRSKERQPTTSISDSSHGSQEASADFLNHDRAQLKIHSNKKVVELLGESRLTSAEKSFQDLQPVATTGAFVFHTDKQPISDSEAPGGSDVKSCAICWKAFGTLTHRKHRCRISRRHICDECSSKRILDGDDEHRVSDGQFHLARTDMEESRLQNQQKTSTNAGARDQKHIAAGIDRLEADEAANRDSLFGNVMDNMTKAMFGEDDQASSQSQSESIQGLSDTLNQTRNQLNERGDKLNTLADKSDRLVNASKDFASMAKELNKQSQSGFFW